MNFFLLFLFSSGFFVALGHRQEVLANFTVFFKSILFIDRKKQQNFKVHQSEDMCKINFNNFPFALNTP